MTDQKISDLATLTGASVATDDFFEVVDKSDTTMAAPGTNKQITADEIRKALARFGLVSADALWDTKGDLAVGTGADTASRLAVGSDGSQILVADSTQTTGLRWTEVGRPTSFDLAIMRGGDFGGMSANECHFFRVRDGGSISKIAIAVGTSSGNVCVAAYSNTGTGINAAPGTRLATSGSVACPAAGYAEVSLGATVTLMPGDWLALAIDNATATVLVQLNNGTSFTAGNSLLKGRHLKQTTAFPAPSPVGTLAAWYQPIALAGVA